MTTAPSPVAAPVTGPPLLEPPLQRLVMAQLEELPEALTGQGPPRRVLVAAASKYESTTEIAQAIAKVLGERGFDANAADIDPSVQVEGFDAFVIGSAVYSGHWLQPARWFVQSHAAVLSTHPVWLFSSGPVGEPPMTDEDPVDVTAIAEATLAREHKVFPGRLEHSRLSIAEQALVVALRAPEGDFRDWDAIRSWAEGIADALNAAGPATTTGTITLD
ncbi:flavodoxin domain-containing protein [Catellatospora sp. IY07-71]|uniref:flavodoxin domain-containing protein n=1 Tax=Catellatospora sp. IY07-71 TaxID=2728827 RepID=UPI001BB42902|nr:flavodoxin domain-containing protein [Catellatospora sp. IY07-71]